MIEIFNKVIWWNKSERKERREKKFLKEESRQRLQELLPNESFIMHSSHFAYMCNRGTFYIVLDEGESGEYKETGEIRLEYDCYICVALEDLPELLGTIDRLEKKWRDTDGKRKEKE